MIRIFRKLLGLCIHEWTIIDKKAIYGDGFGFMNEYRTGTQYTLQCKHCGKIKFKRT